MLARKEPLKIDNLFADIPATLPDELCEPLIDSGHFRLERIVSRQHATPPDQWYDQSADEWILLLSGRAALRFEKPDRTVVLAPGDHLLIPAGRRHRVDWTDPDRDTLWLALHFLRA